MKGQGIKEDQIRTGIIDVLKRQEQEYLSLEKNLATSQSAFDRMNESIARSGIPDQEGPLINPAGVSEWLRIAAKQREDQARLEAFCHGLFQEFIQLAERAHYDCSENTLMAALASTPHCRGHCLPAE